jgi:F-type H+-transporting ATPase subunit gamma
MCGGYNTQLLQFAESQVHKGEGDPKIITVGVYAEQYFRKHGYEPFLTVYGASQDPSLYNARSISEAVIQLFLSGECAEVYVIYTGFLSTGNQKPLIRRLLPLSAEPAQDAAPPEILYEPSPQLVFDLLTPQYATGLIYCALVQAYASEHAARMRAMQSSTENADEMLARLKSQYNMARQAAITREIIEISGAANAQRKDII